ncbi:MAG: glycosyltransferase family 2 protein [Chitinophagaceae bacterium]|nr:glycosyltransferase family 2 protein [Oligoflexus sp.]
MTIDFSLILACYQDAPHLRKNTLQLVKILQQSRLNFEIVFVEDASRDNSAAEIRATLAELAGLGVAHQALFHAENKGRGRTVTDGIRIAKGAVVGFIDIDLEHLPDALLPMIAKVQEGADVVVGRRVIANPGAKPLRVLSSWVYKTLVHFILELPVADTEAGLKVFSRAAILPILNITQDEQWFWDTEVVHRAYLKGLRCEEHPIVFLEKPEKQSTVRILPDTILYLKKLMNYKLSLSSTLDVHEAPSLSLEMVREDSTQSL